MKTDLIGSQFGRLTVVRLAGKQGKRNLWECKCSCGKIVYITTTNLRSNHSRSCGCLKKDLHTKHGHRARGASHPLYGVWDNMKQRCSNPNATEYDRYGGRGIKICQDWLSDFQTFYTWAVNHGYKKGLQLDRIDNDGDYTPDNCRWVTRSDNQNNRSTNHIIEWNGESHTVAEWSRITGISRKALDYRIAVGKPIEEIMRS